MKTLLMKFPVLGGAVTAGVMTAILLSGCATHRYAPSDSYARQSPIEVMKYGDDWFAAARAGRGDILQALMDAGFPPDAKTPDGYTALVLSAYNGHAATLRQLLAAGADACAPDKRGNTALMGALFKGENDIAMLLLDTRCDIDQVNNAGETALAFATLFGRTDMLAPLVAHGADPNHADARGGTPLQLALDQRTPEVAAALRRVGAK